MKPVKRNYNIMHLLCAELGLFPYKNRSGREEEGIYSFKGLDAPIDLTACAEDTLSILKTAIQQLSETVDESYQQAIDRDLSNH